jgi:AcrR family transcriptional regulator
VIIARTLALAKTTPLHDLSIVRVAREIGVAPGLVHYYLGGRDALLSGVMNAFYRVVVKDWPEPSGDWRVDLASTARWFYAKHVQYRGIAAYVASHNRFRMAQLVEAGESDYGILLFERFTGTVRAVGLDSRRTAIYAQLLVDFFVTSAHSTVRRRWPGEHGAFIDEVLARLDPTLYPNATFVRQDFAAVDATSAFDAGLQLILFGLERELETSPPRRHRAASKR